MFCSRSFKIFTQSMCISTFTDESPRNLKVYPHAAIYPCKHDYTAATQAAQWPASSPPEQAAGQTCLSQCLQMPGSAGCSHPDTP